MPLGPTAQAAQANPLQAIMAVLAGSGFKHMADGVNKLGQSGTNLQQLFSMPNMPLMMAGAGIKDAGNSMELISPIMKMLTPPPPPAPPDPKDINAAMAMISARLGPGQTGLQPPMTPPMGGGGMPGGTGQSGY